MPEQGLDYSSLFNRNLPPPPSPWEGHPKYNFIGGHSDPAMVPMFDQTLRDLQDMLSAWSVVDGREPAPVDRGRRGGQF